MSSPEMLGDVGGSSVKIRNQVGTFVGSGEKSNKHRNVDSIDDVYEDDEEENKEEVHTKNKNGLTPKELEAEIFERVK